MSKLCCESPETSTSWEAGIKSRFADNRIQLNVVGFFTDYDNFQAQSAVLLGTPPVPQIVLNNVGKLRTKGFEVELTAKPTDWLRIDGGASYTDAIMRSFPAAQGYAGQTGQVWNGELALTEAAGAHRLGTLQLSHDMAVGAGAAQIDVQDLVFARGGLQPAQITPLAARVASEVEGKASFTGRIGWSAAGLTSSGRASTTGLNFRASMGQVTGLKGESRDEQRAKLQAYLADNPQTAAEVRAIRQPMTDLRARCGIWQRAQLGDWQVLLNSSGRGDGR